jgi:hypothetical protein
MGRRFSGIGRPRLFHAARLARMLGETVFLVGLVL